MTTALIHRPARTLLAASALIAGALATPAGAAPLTVSSGSLDWAVPRETGAQRGYTLAGYSSSIGAGSVDATAPATGASITPTSTPGAGLNVTYPFDFPTPTAGTVGTYDPVAKTGSIAFAGTVTFTAHGGTFLSVVNPTISFDAPQSARVIASGVVSPPQTATDPTPVAYNRTIFALDASASTQTANPDGTYTISGLAPASTGTSFLSSNAVFDGIRPFFGTERANQGFTITIVPQGVTPQPTPTPTPTPTETPEPTPTQTPEPTPTETPAPTATPEPTATAVPTPTPGAYAPQVIPTPAPIAIPVPPIAKTSTLTATLTKQPFSKLTIKVSVRARGTNTKSLGTGSVKGKTLTVTVPTGTKLKGDYVLTRTSGSKKLAKSAVVTVKTGR